MSSATHKMESLSPEEKRVLVAQLLRKKASQPKSYPLSFAQQRMWFLEQLEPDTANFNVPIALHLKGRLNVPALEQAGV